jgi:hypothetical protein
MNFSGPPSTTLPILLTPHYQRAHAEFMSGSQTKTSMKADEENEVGSKRALMVRLGHGARWRERTSKEQVEREVEDLVVLS